MIGFIIMGLLTLAMLGYVFWVIVFAPQDATSQSSASSLGCSLTVLYVVLMGIIIIFS